MAGIIISGNVVSNNLSSVGFRIPLVPNAGIIYKLDQPLYIL